MVEPILPAPLFQPTATPRSTYYDPNTPSPDLTVADFSGLSRALQANQQAHNKLKEADASTDEFLASLAVPAGQAVPNDANTAKQNQSFRGSVPPYANPFNISLGVTEAAARDLVTKFEAQLGKSLPTKMRVVDEKGNLLPTPDFNKFFFDEFKPFAAAPVLAANNRIGRRAASQLLQNVKQRYELAWSEAEAKALNQHHTELVINELAMDVVDPKTGQVLSTGSFQQLVDSVRSGDAATEATLQSTITQQITDRIYNRGLDPATVLGEAISTYIKKESMVSAPDALFALDVMEDLMVGNQRVGDDARFADMLAKFRQSLQKQEEDETDRGNRMADNKAREATRLLSDKFVPMLSTSKSPGQLNSIYEEMRQYSLGLDESVRDEALLYSEELYLQAKASPVRDDQNTIDRIRTDLVNGDIESARTLLRSAPPEALSITARQSLAKEIDNELSGQGVSAISSDIRYVRSRVEPKIESMPKGYHKQSQEEVDRILTDALRKANSAFTRLPEAQRNGAVFKDTAAPFLAEADKQIQQLLGDFDTQQQVARKELETLARTGDQQFQSRFSTLAWQLDPQEAQDFRVLYNRVNLDQAYLDGNPAYDNLKRRLTSGDGLSGVESQAIITGLDKEVLKFLDEARKAGNLNQDSFTTFVRNTLQPKADEQARAESSSGQAITRQTASAIEGGASVEEARARDLTLRAQVSLSQNLVKAIQSRSPTQAVAAIKALSTEDTGLFASVPKRVHDSLLDFYADKDDDWPLFVWLKAAGVKEQALNGSIHSAIVYDVSQREGITPEQVAQVAVDSHLGFYLPAQDILDGVWHSQPVVPAFPFDARFQAGPPRQLPPALALDISKAQLPQAGTAYFRSLEDLDKARQSEKWPLLMQRIGVGMDQLSQDVFVTNQAQMIKSVFYDG